MIHVRPPAVSGSFYPDDPQRLTEAVDALLSAANAPEGPQPKAVIVPHAGYVYSGPIAASIYAALRPYRDVIRRVVLVGPAHRVVIEGLAAPDVAAFETPLGVVPVAAEALSAALALAQVQRSGLAHAMEHSLEVQLPFLQRVLGSFDLVPLAVGEAGAEEVAEVLERLWGGEETLIVISSDLSHFLDYEAARALDARTKAAIEALAPEAIGRDQACGRAAIQGLLLVAARRGLHARTLDLRSSGDTAGGRDRVVGYGAWAFSG